MDYILKERKLFLFVLIISILFLYGSINISYNMYDEGIVVYGASRILKGDIPYRDFWTMYAPGQFYTVAFLFKIFGENLFVSRVYSATVNLLIVLLVYFIVKKVSDERLALLSMVLSTLWMGGWGLFYSSPTPSGTFWSLLGIYFVIDFLSTEKVSSLFTGGIITGIGAIFRHDIGGYTFIASTIVILFYAYLKISDRSIKDTIKLWGRYLAGTVAGFLPFAIYFLVNVPFGEIIYDLIIFPGKVFLRVRDLPYPGFGFNLYSFLF
ncbi:MAG TPA: glycosyltransferase family 39 protein, partial [bacterium]|nr:glycosyltransferase family 39 protein [bacterium]